MMSYGGNGDTSKDILTGRTIARRGILVQIRPDVG
jgi:hypothetical protein